MDVAFNLNEILNRMIDSKKVELEDLEESHKRALVAFAEFHILHDLSNLEKDNTFHMQDHELRRKAQEIENNINSTELTIQKLEKLKNSSDEKKKERELDLLYKFLN